VNVLNTRLVVTGKETLVVPAGTMTLAATAATAGLVLDSRTTEPPAGAAAVSVAVPSEGLPPMTLVGVRLRVESAGGTGSTINDAVRVTAL